MAFVDNAERAREAAAEIRAEGEATGYRPVVINTVIDPHLSALLAESGALMLDVFAPFIAPLEAELGVPRTPHVGKAHGGADSAEYDQRMNATNFALTHDDGVQANFSDAEIILVGVSPADADPRTAPPGQPLRLAGTMPLGSRSCRAPPAARERSGAALYPHEHRGDRQ